MRDERGRITQIHTHIIIHNPPMEIGTIVGDVVHNLRAALDLMACDLVRNGGGNPNNVYFPFCDKPEELARKLKDKNFHRAGARAISLLEELKPYRGGNAALRAIHDMDVQDKHQTLIPIWTQSSGELMAFRVSETFEITEAPWPVSSPEVAFVFPKGHVFDGKEIVPMLHEFVQLTTGIVEAFAAL
jgi:hypothetical protein